MNEKMFTFRRPFRLARSYLFGSRNTGISTLVRSNLGVGERVRRNLGISLGVVLVSILVGSAGAGAWAGWYGSFSVGGVGTTSAASIGVQTAPTTTGTGGEIVVSWPAASLGSGTIKNYTVARYSGSVAQTVTGACAGTVANTGCVEIGVPAGTWTYTATPILTGTSWVGSESAKSVAVTTTGTAGSNNLWFWVTP